jgi:hypothetical protein
VIASAVVTKLPAVVHTTKLFETGDHTAATAAPELTIFVGVLFVQVVPSVEEVEDPAPPLNELKATPKVPVEFVAPQYLRAVVGKS